MIPGSEPRAPDRTDTRARRSAASDGSPRIVTSGPAVASGPRRQTSGKTQGLRYSGRVRSALASGSSRKVSVAASKNS